MSAKIVWLPIVAFSAIGLAACNKTNTEPSLFRMIPSETASLATDAKHRVIINRTRYKPPTGSVTLSNRQICVEPSPDVTQAFSEVLKITASLSTAATGANGAEQPPGAGFGFTNSLASSVVQLGERLAVIQLFRDRMYRACEAYANGAINEVAYTLMLARNDKTMATLLTTEMAAGAFGRSLAQLGGSAGVNPKEREKLSEEREKLSEDIDRLTSQLSEIAKSNDNQADREKKVEPVVKQLALSHTKLLALDLAAARTSALSNVVGSTPGSISNRANTSSHLVGLSSQLAGIHRTFTDDPGLEPLTDACLTVLSRISLTADQATTLSSANVLRDDATEKLQSLQIASEFRNTVDKLNEILDSNFSDLTDKDENYHTAINLGVSTDDNGRITEKNLRDTIELAEEGAKAELDLKNAKIEINQVFLTAGSPFASFCVTDVFGALHKNGYLRTMIRARKELRAESRPTSTEVQLKQLEICNNLIANLSQLEKTEQDKVLAMCVKLLR